MKQTFVTLLLFLSVSTAHAEYQFVKAENLQVFKREFTVPLNAKNISVAYGKYKDTVYYRETWAYVPCVMAYPLSSPRGECMRIKNTSEETLRVGVTYETALNVFDSFETNFRLNELDRGKLHRMPRLKAFFARNAKANPEFVSRELIEIQIEKTETEQIVKLFAR